MSSPTPNKSSSSQATTLIASVLIAGSIVFLGLQIGSSQGGQANSQDIAKTVQDTVKQEIAKQDTAAKQPTAKPEKDMTKVPEVSPTEHIQGNKNAKFAIIEYSEFLCGFCKKFYPEITKVMDEYSDKIMWVYRNYPIFGNNPLSEKHALAAECVSSLGGNEAFWSFSDKIFTTTIAADKASEEYEKMIADLGIDKNAFNSCVEEKKFLNTLNKTKTEARAAGITGTPGNVIMNVETKEAEFLGGYIQADALKAKIDAFMAKYE